MPEIIFSKLKYTTCNSPKTSELNKNKINKISKNLQRNIQEPYHIWTRLNPSSLYVKGSLGSVMTVSKMDL